jgi:hypothetical protein
VTVGLRSYLRILVYLVIHDSGQVSLEHLLLSRHPSLSSCLLHSHANLEWCANKALKSAADDFLQDWHGFVGIIDLFSRREQLEGLVTCCPDERRS